jgi:hypothetical protein
MTANINNKLKKEAHNKETSKEGNKNDWNLFVLIFFFF